MRTPKDAARLAAKIEKMGSLLDGANDGVVRFHEHYDVSRTGEESTEPRVVFQDGFEPSKGVCADSEDEEQYLDVTGSSGFRDLQDQEVEKERSRLVDELHRLQQLELQESTSTEDSGGTKAAVSEVSESGKTVNAKQPTQSCFGAGFKKGFLEAPKKRESSAEPRSNCKLRSDKTCESRSSELTAKEPDNGDGSMSHAGTDRAPLRPCLKSAKSRKPEGTTDKPSRRRVSFQDTPKTQQPKTSSSHCGALANDWTKSAATGGEAVQFIGDPSSERLADRGNSVGDVYDKDDKVTRELKAERREVSEPGSPREKSEFSNREQEELIRRIHSSGEALLEELNGRLGLSDSSEEDDEEGIRLPTMIEDIEEAMYKDDCDPREERLQFIDELLGLEAEEEAHERELEDQARRASPLDASDPHIWAPPGPLEKGELPSNSDDGTVWASAEDPRGTGSSHTIAVKRDPPRSSNGKLLDDAHMKTAETGGDNATVKSSTHTARAPSAPALGAAHGLPPRREDPRVGRAPGSEDGTPAAAVSNVVTERSNVRSRRRRSRRTA